MRQAILWIQGAEKRIKLWHRDIKIAKDLHLGWQHLAQLYDLTKSGVYYAAARGRKYLQQSERKD